VPDARTPVNAGAASALQVGMPSKAYGRRTWFVPYVLAGGGRVQVLLSGPAPGLPVRIYDGERAPGGYVFSVDMSEFGAGRYRCSVRAGEREEVREILLGD